MPEGRRQRAEARKLTAEDAGLILLVASLAAVALIWVSPWLLLPLAGFALARASGRLPELLCDPVRGIGRLTFYATLPVGIAGLALAIGKGVLPADDYLRLMLRIYDLRGWTGHQLWLKPVVLAPLLGAAGVLSIVMARPGIIALLGRFAGLIGQAALSLYVLSLFTLVAPGPFELKLNQATAEMRGHLQASLQLQRDAAKQYLAKQSVMVLLADRAAVAQSHLADVVRDTDAIKRRLGCAPRATASFECLMAPYLEAAFEKSIPQLSAPSGAAAGATAPQPDGLPALTQDVADADAATDTLRRKNEAAAATIDVMIGALSDLLPFGEVANAVIGEISAAVASRFDDAAVARLFALTGFVAAALDGAAVTRLVVDVPRAIAAAAGRIHDAVLRRGPWVLVFGLDATQARLDAAERDVAGIEARMSPGSTVNAELQRELHERSGSGTGGNGEPLVRPDGLDPDARSAPLRAP